MVDRAAGTDPESFFRAHYPELYRFVSAASGFSPADVEDVVQETLVQAWRDRGRFESASAPLTWLLGVARNRVVDLLRRRRVMRDAGALLRTLGRLETDELPSDVLESAELGVRVRQALGGLPKDYAELLIWRYLEERPVKAIADLTRETEDSIESRLRRAREALRQRLNEGADHGK